MYKNLNPTWNEFFSFPIRDLQKKLHIKVFKNYYLSSVKFFCNIIIIFLWLLLLVCS